MLIQDRLIKPQNTSSNLHFKYINNAMPYAVFFVIRMGNAFSSNHEAIAVSTAWPLARLYRP